MKAGQEIMDNSGDRVSVEVREEDKSLGPQLSIKGLPRWR